MCEACHTEQPVNKKRLKLGDIDTTYHCSVVGTCLSLHELDKLAKKSQMVFPATAAPYQKHGSFVGAISQAPALARVTHKYLDRKYASTIRKSRQIKCSDDLDAYWEEAKNCGDVPGPFWACMTHPLADGKIKARIFGDVHMLSHLVGASNRADIKMLGKLESERDRYQALFENARIKMKRLVQQKNQTITRQENELAQGQKDMSKFRELQIQITRMEDGSTRKQEAEKLLDMERQLVVTTGQNAELAAQLQDYQLLSAENKKLTKELDTLHKEHDALETLTHQKLSEFCDTCDLNTQTPPERNIDLDGTTIAYVGGRTGHIGSFKMLVEDANGEFLHHDGGLEDSDHRLTQIISGCDVVMCPMDCVSHQASLRAKKFCKHSGKKFIPLRSAGLSSFIASLQDFSIRAQPN